MADYYLISKEHLKKLCLEKLSDDEKMEIQIAILSRPYNEPISKSILKGLGAAVDKVGEIADHLDSPEQKKTKKR